MLTPGELLTSEVEHDEDLAEVGDGEVVSVSDGGGGDHQEPDAVEEGHLARRPRVLVAVEGVALVLHEEHQPGPPQQEPRDLGQQLGIVTSSRYFPPQY